MTIAIHIARHGEQDLRLDLAQPVNRRTDAEFGGRRGPTARGSPKPTSAITASGMLGRYAATRSPLVTPRRTSPARQAQTFARELGHRNIDRSTGLRASDHGRPLEFRAAAPSLRSSRWNLGTTSYRACAAMPTRSFRRDRVPHRAECRPEPVDVGHGPSPEGPIVAKGVPLLVGRAAKSPRRLESQASGRGCHKRLPRFARDALHYSLLRGRADR